MQPIYSFGGGFDLIWNVFPFLFIAVFAVAAVGIIARLVKGAAQYQRNNASPVLTVDCTVVAKRTDVNHFHHPENGAMTHTTTSTNYYVTFQVESGDRLELNVSGQEYGLLAEGDRGKLTFQGTRYKGFSRL